MRLIYFVTVSANTRVQSNEEHFEQAGRFYGFVIPRFYMRSKSIFAE